MLIVSQDKDGIINFENITAIRLIINLEDNKRNMIAIDTVNAERYTVAKYVTEKRAKEVLQEIVKTYVLTEQYKVEDERTRIKLMMEGILLYEMPRSKNMRKIRIGDIVTTHDGKHKGKILNIWTGLDQTDTITIKVRIQEENGESYICEIDDIVIA